MPTHAEIPFKFELPVEIWKAAEPGKRRRIGGIISTDKIDRQGEQVLQRGLDFKDFLKNGWFNDNHTKDTTGIVGYPEKVKRVQYRGRPAHYVEGYLLDDFDRADEIWKLARSLQKTNRRLGFSVEGSVVRREGAMGNIIAEARVRNVAITNCFPGDVSVVGAGDSITRRMYSGPMVEIELSTGEKLTGTPNHPVFTDRGWVALGDLDEVFDRVGRYVGNSSLAVSTPIAHHVNNVPTLLQEIFDLSKLSCTSSRVCPARKRQFHGDGLGGDVDVISIYRHLRMSLYSAFDQQFGEDALTASDKELPLLSDLRFSPHFDVSGRFSSPSFICGGREGFSFGGSPSAVPAELFLSAGPGASGSFGQVIDGDPRDPVFGGDCGRTLSRAVGFDNLRSKRIFNFSGHVFNLDTRNGWYSANGIIAHNCPVNDDTGLEVLAKSLQASEEEMRRGMMAGQAVSAPPAAPGEGFPLRTEALERKRKKKTMRKAEALCFLQRRYPGMTIEQAERVWTYLAARPR